MIDDGREVVMLREGERVPAVVGTSYDGRTIDLGAPGKRTVLWFTPKAGLIDDVSDVLGLAGP